MADAVARFIKKVAPKRLVRAAETRVASRPLSPMGRVTAPLAATAAAVLALGAVKHALAERDEPLTRVPDIYLQRLDLDAALSAAASASAQIPILPPQRPPPIAGALRIDRFHGLPPPMPLIPERAHDGPHGVIVQKNEGALR